jgi:hypothetical protein
VGNETICCHEQQLFWCTDRDDWIAANQLQLGDALLTFDKQLLLIDISIMGIQQHGKSLRLEGRALKIFVIRLSKMEFLSELVNL